jgi:hypothetical protein
LVVTLIEVKAITALSSLRAKTGINTIFHYLKKGVSEKYKNWWYGYTIRGASQFIVRREKT